jgi:hypothetical protein
LPTVKLNVKLVFFLIMKEKKVSSRRFWKKIVRVGQVTGNTELFGLNTGKAQLPCNTYKKTLIVVTMIFWINLYDNGVWSSPIFLPAILLVPPLEPSTVSRLEVYSVNHHYNNNIGELHTPLSYRFIQKIIVTTMRVFL